MRKWLVLLLMAAVGMAFAGCGSSESAPVEVTLNSAIDGTVFSDSTMNTHLDDGTEMGVGDNNGNIGLQDLISFTLDLPAGAHIKSATLRLRSSDFAGAAFPSSILFEHLHVDFGTIDPTDFAANPADLTSCGAFSSLTIGGWNELDVSLSVQEDQAATRGKSQFRLYRIPVTDGDGQWDNNSFYTSESGTYKPELVITYTL